MEFALGRSGHEGRVKEEKRSESSGGVDDDSHPNEVIDVEVPLMDTSGPSASSTKKEENEELEFAKAEMGEVKEENQRLKKYLERVLKDYRTLQMQFQDIVQKETKHQCSDKLLGREYDHDQSHQEIMTEESELVSLSLGRSVLPRSYEKSKIVSKPLILKDHEEYKKDLALGLDCKFETSKSGSTKELGVPNIASPVNSSDEVPKEKQTGRDAGEDEVSQQNNPAKKARVCVRARCDTPTMNDGCQWRKYGQKIAKGNPCPRAYYRCTVAPSCPVRKQVQRCAEDLSTLITTYEGIHNHPLPLSATAMASTTSAAASMLLSGSSTSRPGSLPLSLAAAAPTSADLQGLNFYLSDGSKSRQFYLSNPTLSSLHYSAPTVTLDLTNPVSRFTSNFNPPRSFNFSSPYNDFLTNTNNRNSSINLARPAMENVNHKLLDLQKNSIISNHTPPPPSSHALPDTIAAATKAITADPKFQSALAMALTSIINGAGSGTQANGNHGGAAQNLAHKIKWGDLFPASS